MEWNDWNDFAQSVIILSGFNSGWASNILYMQFIRESLKFDCFGSRNTLKTSVGECFLHSDYMTLRLMMMNIQIISMPVASFIVGDD